MSRIEGAIASAAFDRIVERALSDVRNNISCTAHYAIGDTPIERTFFCALWAMGSLSHHRGFRVVVSDGSRVPAPETIAVTPQYGVIGYIVDFVLSVQTEAGDVKSLLIECDGHDFHERTKDQAARDRTRDREFQAAGFTIFRFTGSEIFRDPCACADAAISWLTKG